VQKSDLYDVIVIGAGAAGLIAAISAAREGKKTLLLEKLPNIGAKLKATGGGRCNLTNTLANEEFMARFGRNGRFMTTALKAFDHRSLISFFEEIGVESHAPDGFRVFPLSHDSVSVVSALESEIKRLGVLLICSAKVERLEFEDARICGVSANGVYYKASNVIVAAGGLGYPKLGAEGDGFALASSAGHKIEPPHPAMLPLHTKESWVASCRADTVAKAQIRIDMPKAKNLRAVGDLIFTQRGVRGPVVLDFAREITPLLQKYGEVPIFINMTKGMNEEEIRLHLKEEADKNPHLPISAHIETMLAASIAKELCILADIDPSESLKKIAGAKRDKLIKLLAWTPLTITGHEGFKAAMITRGGVSLKEICPETMESRLIRGLYFCGEVMDLDGPCGGYNLQWSFASGFLAGRLGDAPAPLA